MSNLSRNETFLPDLFNMRRNFDRIFDHMSDRMIDPFGWEGNQSPRSDFNFLPAVEAYVDKDSKKYICRLTLPGLDPKDIHIHAQGSALTISGERKVASKTKSTDMLHDEITYGSFTRTLRLPEGVDVTKLAAVYNDGVLEITSPVADAALPRRVEVKIGKAENEAQRLAA